MPRRGSGRPGPGADGRYPPGVDNGTRIRLSGKGEAGPHGAPRATSTSSSTSSRMPVFQREGTALFTRVPVSFTTAALGGAIEIPGLDGEMHAIGIPPGIQSRPAAAQARRRHAGAPGARPRRPGDRDRGRVRPRSSARGRRNCCASSARPKPARNARKPGFFAKLKECLQGLRRPCRKPIAQVAHPLNCAQQGFGPLPRREQLWLPMGPAGSARLRRFPRSR